MAHYKMLWEKSSITRPKLNFHLLHFKQDYQKKRTDEPKPSLLCTTQQLDS